MIELKWETPPAVKLAAGGGAPRKWKPILDALRERPGEWALIAENVNSTLAWRIARGKLGGVPEGEFEATTRGVSGSRAEKLYARYVGGAK